MIYNLSTILRQTYNTNKTVSNPVSNPVSKRNPPPNLKINIELANQKSLELYKKYNTNTYRNTRIIDLSPALKSNLDIVDKNPSFYIKNGFVIGCFCILLASFRYYSFSFLKNKQL